MQLEAQDYLDMVEETGKLCFFDIESTGFKADYDSVLVVSIKPYGQKPYSITVNQVGNDVGVVMKAKQELEKYHCWASYYGKGFDLPFLNTRLLKWKKGSISPRHHLDLYFALKPKMALSRRSLAQLARFLKLPEQKMDLGPDVWQEVAVKPKNLKILKQRCESDVILLEHAYNKTRDLIREIKRG